MLVFLGNLVDLSLEAAPWLALGLVATALIRAVVPDAMMKKWVGGRGVGSVLRAAIVGAPLPLCSCGVIPAAVGLRRQGASPGATASFLVATPETGVDSLAISYAMLGPFLTIARPIAALVSAVVTGLMVQAVAVKQAVASVAGAAGASGATVELSITNGNDEYGKNGAADTMPSTAGEACCGSGSCCSSDHGGEPGDHKDPLRERLGEGMRFATSQLLDDIALWIVVGLLIAAAMVTLLDPAALAGIGSGPLAMGVMAVVGIPMYVCSTGATPLAAGLLLAGVSPGTVLVLLLAGPATNIATIGVVKRELGLAAAGMYLAGIAGVSIAIGMTVDAIASAWSIDTIAQASASDSGVPVVLAWTSLVALVLLAIRPLRRKLLW